MKNQFNIFSNNIKEYFNDFKKELNEINKKQKTIIKNLIKEYQIQLKKLV